MTTQEKNQAIKLIEKMTTKAGRDEYIIEVTKRTEKGSAPEWSLSIFQNKVHYYGDDEKPPIEHQEKETLIYHPQRILAIAEILGLYSYATTELKVNYDKPLQSKSYPNIVLH